MEGQTLGTIHLSEKANDKLVLFSPNNGNTSYLIDECGFIVNSWTSQYRPGLASYLDNEGNLYRAGRINSSVFSAGGLGGIIEKYNWEGELLWSWQLANDNFHLHHDFFVRENGNLIVIAWESVAQEELEGLGRENVSAQFFYSEQILEIDPNKNFEVVWRWRAIDHVIQDKDQAKPNFGDPLQNARRFDINLNELVTNDFVDWLHINAVHYDAELDVIALSCNSIDEVVFIDRSATPTKPEGDYGYGGDLLFRWGNPGNIGLANLDRQLFKQHDIRFYIEDDAFHFSVFNNGRRIFNENYSSVDLIDTRKAPVDLFAEMVNESLQATRADWSFNGSAEFGMYSKRMSSAQQFDGGWLICSSDDGRIIQIDEEGELIWEYINPVGPGRIFEQGEVAFANTMFQATAYEYGYFESDISLQSSMEKIELGASEDCIEETSSTVFFDSDEEPELEIKYDGQNLHVKAEGHYQIEILNMRGQKLHALSKFENDFCCSIEGTSQLILISLRNSRTGSMSINKLFVSDY